MDLGVEIAAIRRMLDKLAAHDTTAVVEAAVVGIVEPNPATGS